jgi:hypothetical protein
MSVSSGGAGCARRSLARQSASHGRGSDSKSCRVNDAIGALTSTGHVYPAGERDAILLAA